ANTNPYGKTRKQDNPYAVYEDKRTGWTWKILKLNQRPDMAAKNQYASAFCAVSSPMTMGSSDLGDTYLSDIGGTLVSGPDILKECGRR
ncbi:hypothetical protein, partial [Enterococcus faecium]|uniref:hypothetical protein n=1 Tax=Enterococcus faecium TaxID=1352 RepID=UPI0034E959E7